VIESYQVIESVDRRILGAFVCVDAITGNSIVPAIPVSAPQWTVKPNLSGVYVIFDGPGFDAQTDEFLPTGTWPAPATFEVTLQDPSGRYLPRRANVKAPLAVPVIPPPMPTPTGVFAPQKVALYPTPAASTGPNWAVLHASVTDNGTPPKGLRWAVLQAVQTSDGEPLLAVIGLTGQVNVSGGGPVTVSTVPVTVTAYFDPGIKNEPADWIPNPDDILGNLSNPALVSSSQSVQLGSGQEISLAFVLAV